VQRLARDILCNEPPSGCRRVPVWYRQRYGSPRHQMNETLVEVFLGDPIEDPVELHILQRLRGDLCRRGVSARVFANFVAAGRQQRQIDLLVATQVRLVHAELKALNQDLPVIGPVNGPWKQLLPDGQQRMLERNPYRQAREGIYAISDVIRDLARRGQVPGGAAFYKHIDTVVCVYPVIPGGSQLAPYAHVEVVGYEELLARLTSPGPVPPWEPPHWNAFTRGLGVFPEAQESPAQRLHRADAAAVADYRRHFRSFHSVDLHELVPVAAEVDGQLVPQPDVAGLALEQRTIVIGGPSGIGKTHATRHAAIDLTDRGHVVVWLRCGEYEQGRFGVLLARTVGPFTTEPALDFLRKAVSTGSAVIVILDGFNECPSRLHQELLEQLSALRLQVPVGIVITSSVLPPLPAALPTTIVQLGQPDAAERLAILASYGVTEPDLVGDAFTTPYELALAAQCANELDPGMTPTDLLDAYVRRRAKTLSVRAALGCLAAAMDADVRTSLTIAEAIAVLQRRPDPGLPPAIVDEALACPLLVRRQARVSFAHELLVRFLAAEHLVVQSTDGADLGHALAQPHHQDLHVHSLLLERDPQRRHEALLTLADPDLLTKAAPGEFGDASAAQVCAAVCSLLAEGQAATVGAEIDPPAPDRWVLVWRTARAWSPSDRALLTVAGRCLGHGMFIREVAALLDQTDEVCVQQVARLRTAGYPEPISAVVAAAYGIARTDAPSCLPASIVLKACEYTHPIRRFKPTGRAATAAMFSAGPAAPSWGRLYAATLLYDSRHPDDAIVLPELLLAAWTAGGYHLRLQALTAAHDVTGILNDPTRSRVIGALDKLHTDNLALSTTLVETLAAYEQITPIANLADIRAQIRGVLSREDEREAWAAARTIVARQFDTETVVGPYSEAIGELAERDQLRLFVMAARAPESEFWEDWLLSQIADHAPSMDRRGRQALRDAAMPVKTHTPFWQGAIVAHLEGLRGWAQLSDHLPDPAEVRPQDADRRAWRCFDELIFRLERDGDRADSSNAARQWSMLLERYASAAVDVLYHLRRAAIVGSELRPSVHDWLMQAYPDEVRRLLEWGLAHRDELTTSFPHVNTDERQQYIVRTLGHVGRASTAVLLRDYLANPALAGEAVTAIRQIEQRDGTLG
jgi:Nuclease-related domain